MPISGTGHGWSTDKDKFGFRMLTKMGWSEGKGLGANEDGNLEHIKVNKKRDMKGVGHTHNPVDNWLENNSGFASVLSRLNSVYSKGKSSSESSDSDSDADSDDKKSSNVIKKPAGARYRYHKLVKAKTAKGYSEIDVKAILGGTKKKDSDDEAEDLPDENAKQEVERLKIKNTSGSSGSRDNDAEKSSSDESDDAGSNSDSESSDGESSGGSSSDSSSDDDTYSDSSDDNEGSSSSSASSSSSSESSSSDSSSEEDSDDGSSSSSSDSASSASSSDYSESSSSSDSDSDSGVPARKRARKQ